MHPALLGHTARQQQLVNILASWRAPNDSATFAQIQRPHSVAAILGNVAVLKLTPDLLSALGVTTQAVDLIFSAQGQHIREKHESLVPAVFEAIPYAMNRIEYIGGSVKDNNIIRTAVGRCQDKRWILVGMKFIPAKYARSGQNEAWGQTAYCFSEPDLLSKIRTKKLRALARKP